MYRPHPEANRLRVLLPQTLVEAVRHPQQATFAEVAEMRATIRDLADFATRQRPRFVTRSDGSWKRKRVIGCLSYWSIRFARGGWSPASGNEGRSSIR
jgi:hypothetical protein